MTYGMTAALGTTATRRRAGSLAIAVALSVLGVSGAAHAHPQPAAAVASQEADVAAAKQVLSAYKSAIERLDVSGVDQLFVADSVVVESGKVEGAYLDYLAHHLGPELHEFRSFTFNDYTVSVRLEGDIAIATETYTYRIELKAGGEPIVRRGAATTVLKRIDGRWRILLTHSSARRNA